MFSSSFLFASFRSVFILLFYRCDGTEIHIWFSYTNDVLMNRALSKVQTSSESFFSSIFGKHSSCLILTKQIFQKILHINDKFYCIQAQLIYLDHHRAISFFQMWIPKTNCLKTFVRIDINGQISLSISVYFNSKCIINDSMLIVHRSDQGKL